MIEEDIDLQEKLKEVAEWVISKKLNAPAIFILEAHKPLVGLGFALVQVSQPLLSVMFGSKNIKIVLKVLERPQSVDDLIELIEEGARQPV